MSKQERIARFYSRMAELGFSYAEASQLRRIEMTLQRWAEAECNGEIQREGDDADGRPYREHGSYVQANDPRRKHYVPDRESGALRRLKAIVAQHEGILAYHQGDCRGCMVYLVKASDVRPGETLDSVYTRGIAVCY